MLHAADLDAVDEAETDGVESGDADVVEVRDRDPELVGLIDAVLEAEVDAVLDTAATTHAPLEHTSPTSVQSASAEHELSAEHSPFMQYASEAVQSASAEHDVRTRYSGRSGPGATVTNDDNRRRSTERRCILIPQIHEVLQPGGHTANLVEHVAELLTRAGRAPALPRN